MSWILDNDVGWQLYTTLVCEQEWQGTSIDWLLTNKDMLSYTPKSIVQYMPCEKYACTEQAEPAVRVEKQGIITSGPTEMLQCLLARIEYLVRRTNFHTYWNTCLWDSKVLMDLYPGQQACNDTSWHNSALHIHLFTYCKRVICFIPVCCLWCCMLIYLISFPLLSLPKERKNTLFGAFEGFLTRLLP